MTPFGGAAPIVARSENERDALGAGIAREDSGAQSRRKMRVETVRAVPLIEPLLADNTPRLTVPNVALGRLSTVSLRLVSRIA